MCLNTLALDDLPTFVMTAAGTNSVWLPLLTTVWTFRKRRWPKLPVRPSLACPRIGASALWMCHSKPLFYSLAKPCSASQRGSVFSCLQSQQPWLKF